MTRTAPRTTHPTPVSRHGNGIVTTIPRAAGPRAPRTRTERQSRRLTRVALGVAILLLPLACKREARGIGKAPPPPPPITAAPGRAQNTVGPSPPSPFVAAATSPDTTPAAPEVPPPAPPPHDSTNPYEGNAFGTAEGKRLYAWMNCSGCHANGGGGIGPPLMDSAWRYGSAPSEIYTTIVAGRPNGMPTFGRRLNSQQVWQLVAYVRSLSGQGPKWSRPGRDDHMAVKTSEQQTKVEKPVRAQPSAPTPPGDTP